MKLFGKEIVLTRCRWYNNNRLSLNIGKSFRNKVLKASNWLRLYHFQQKELSYTSGWWIDPKCEKDLIKKNLSQSLLSNKYDSYKKN